MIVPLTPLEFVRRAAALHGQKTGIVDVDAPARFTYANFCERVQRLGNALLDRGLRPEDRVATLAFNGHELLEAYFAVPWAKGILLPINLRLAQSDISQVLNCARPKFLLVDAEQQNAVQAIFRHVEHPPRVVWIRGCPQQPFGEAYETILHSASEYLEFPTNLDENSVAELFFTSGTTGDPRGVMLTHRNLYLHALAMLITFRCDESDVQLHTIPLFHVNGWGTPQAITAIGATHVVLRSFDPERVLQLVQSERVTRLLAVPTMLTMLLRHPHLKRYDLSSLRLINTGGAPTPPSMVEEAESVLGCRVIGGYGLTETSPIIAFAADKSYVTETHRARMARQASTGMPVIGSELAIVDSNGTPLPWDGKSVGEIVVRSNVVTAGYWGDPDSAASIAKQGWFRTGDLASVDSHGYFTIVDRKKDLIISGGENISSVAIERVLYQHESILECAVIAVPDERWGEVPKALVSLRPNYHTTSEQILAFCRQHLAGFMVPRSVEIVPGLPKGGTGKIMKRQLREPYWREKSKRVH